MNIVLVTSLMVTAVVILGLVIAFFVFQLSKAVRNEKLAMEAQGSQYNPALTVGHQITVDAETEDQLKEARLIAAKKAASLPRGANINIGSYGTDKQPTASDGISADPVSAVKIAEFHTWQGLAPGASSAIAAGKPALAPTQTAPPAKSADDLVPGKDFEYIEITDDMAPAEIRKARIANAKAKSAAVKALKDMPAPPADAPSPASAAPPADTTPQPTAVEETPEPAPAETAPASSSNEPVAGVDYVVIEITDDMGPAEIRSARIANAKAKSAAMKAFKAAGG